MNNEKAVNFVRDRITGFEHPVDATKARCEQCNKAHAVELIKAGVCDTEYQDLVEGESACVEQSLGIFAYSRIIDLLLTLAGVMVMVFGIFKTINGTPFVGVPIVAAGGIFAFASRPFLLNRIRRREAEAVKRYRIDNSRLIEIEKLLN